MNYQPEHLNRWTSADPAFGSTDNYAGDDLSAFYVAPISMGRDTEDALTLSNWRVIGAELASKAKLLTAEVLGKLTGLQLLAPDQEWRREPYPWPGADPSPLAPSLPVGS